ncbi:MAG: hypothetical protein JEZ09_20985 [Salinivirgaceae bacterium]|nr:hypothetical protein [Salinivirgaceae bacterium]
MNQKGEKQFNILGTALLLMFFFFMLSSFVNNTGKTYSAIAKIELAEKVYSDNSNSIQVSFLSLPVFQKEWISLNHRFKFAKSELNSKMIFESHRSINFIGLLNRNFLDFKSRILKKHLHITLKREITFPSILS